MSKTVAEYLADLMVEAGIKNIYGIVGDSANPIVDAVRKKGDALNFIHVRNEEAGAFSAGADSQVTGLPTAVLGSSGPGSLHLLNGLHDCNRNGARVFAIASHIPSTEIGTQFFQETRPEVFFPDCAKMVQYVTSPAQMPRLAELVMQAVMLERGVGVLIVPGDVGAMEVKNPIVERPLPKSRPVVRPSDADLDEAAGVINQAGKVTIYGGEGCREAGDEVLKLSTLIGAPVAYAYRGKDILEADNPNAVGMSGLLGWGAATEAISNCDLLIMLGTDFPYRAFMPDGKPIIQVDENSAHLGRRADVTLGLTGDVGETLRALLPRIEKKSDTGFLDGMVSSHHSKVEALQTYVAHEGSGEGLRPEMVATALSDLAADDAVFAVDTGMCNVWGARYLKMTAKRRLIASFGYGSMANALPHAIGAKTGAPDRQVIALCGDGGFSMLMGELLTVSGWNIPVKLMIFNNSTLGMVRAEMMVSGYVPFGTDVKNPDFGAVAKAVGIYGERVTDANEIRPAIQRALDYDGPALIDFVTDPRALAMPPKTSLKEVEGFSLASMKAVFSGDAAEVWENIKSNVRDARQAL